MNIKSIKDKTNAECLDYLSAKIRAERKKNKLSQSEFALMANIPIRTYKRFEQNCNGNLENFINVLRAFDKLRILEAIFQDELKHKPDIVERFEYIRQKSLSRD